MSEFKYITKPIERVEGKSLALGASVYMEDMIPDRCLVIKLVHSPYAAAEVKSIDTSIAEKVPGVVKIFTWEDTKIQCTTGFNYSPYEHTLLKRVARYQGDAVAMVVAVNEKAAIKARKLIKIDWGIHEPLMDLEESYENDIVVHRDQLDEICRHQDDGDITDESYYPEKNQIKAFQKEYGNFEDELKSCETVINTSTKTSQQMHAMLETHRCYSYVDERGVVVLQGPMQAVYPIQDTVALMLGIDKRKVRAITTKVGGAFGGKNVFSVYMFAAFAAYNLNRPVKLIMTRDESMTCTGTRHEYSLDVTLGASDNGVIHALETNGTMNGGAYCELSDEVLGTGIHNIYPIFPRIDAIKVSQRAVHTNKVMGCAFRGFGATQNVFALNSAVRHLAEKLKMDISEVLLKNIATVGDSHPLMNGYLPEDPAVLKSVGLHECILRAKEMVEWDAKKNLELPKGEVVRGVGIAIATHASGVPREDRAAVIISLAPDGGFAVLSGHSDIGTGSNTITLQLVAEVLDVPMDIVRLQAADTSFTPFDNGTYASSNAYRVGNAVKRAADKMKVLLIKEVKQSYEIAESEEVTFKNEVFYNSHGNEITTLSNFAGERVSYWKGGEPLVVSASFPNDFAPSPYIATTVEIEVDKGTGQYKILKMCSAVDAGTILNPINARVQCLGGFTQSIGMAMFEEVKYTKSNKIISKDYQRYKIPCQMDVPMMELEFVDSYEPTGPFGAKSLGEVTTGTPAPAIADALYNALGVHIDCLPITPETVLRAIKGKE